jgi:hypothetical protein
MENEKQECEICFKAEATVSLRKEGYCPELELQVCHPCSNQFRFDEEYRRVQPHIEALFNCVNRESPGFTTEAFVNAVSRQHRTLQQGFFTWICLLITHYAVLKEDQYDLRNEATVQLCRELLPIVKERFLPYI